MNALTFIQRSTWYTLFTFERFWRAYTMRRGNRYTAYFKNNMFLRILALFSCIAILSIITIAYVTYISISQSMVRRELDTQKAAMESVDRYIHLRHEAVQNMVRDMYRNETLSMNVSFLWTTRIPNMYSTVWTKRTWRVMIIQQMCSPILKIGWMKIAILAI